jgi:hypothetical protein
MADHHYVERTESDSGMAAGMILGIVVLLLVGVMALFFIFGGARGPVTTPAPGQTNVNVPGQQAPPQQQQPNIQVPRQIDVNVNQGQPPAQQAPAQPAPGGR